MILKESIVKLLNFRIKNEEESNRLYLSMSIWLEYHGFNGAAKLWKKYAEEEIDHAEWAYKHLLDLNIQPDVPQLSEQPKEFGGLVDIIQKSYDHEVKITEQCNELAKEAQKEGDYMTLSLALKYQAEQIEELARNNYWIDRLEAFSDSLEALRLLDNEMACKAG